MTARVFEAPRGRWAAIDIARGCALAGMAVYHLSWDLANFGLAASSLPFSPAMRLFSHAVASVFLGLAGVSLALAHREGPRWRAYFVRLARVAGAAAAVSLATWFAAPDEPILFGILHCIVAATLLAAPFLRAPAWTAGLAGVAALAAPLVFANPAFNAPALVWLGLGTVDPSTLDWRPLLPWAGVTLIGLGLARFSAPRLAGAPLARWRPGVAGRGFAFAGRHSLAIYLVHQPVLFALFYAATQWTGVAVRLDRERYLATCRPACVEAGGEIEACAKACECVAGKAATAGLASALTSRAVGDPDRARITGIVGACGAEAR
jgi:uncharacterized membrane protein